MVRLVLLLALVAACGGPATPPSAGNRAAEGSASADSGAGPEKEDAVGESFRATSGAGDAPVPFVRDERSSRLDAPMPRGRLHEAWRSRLGLSAGDPCGGLCPELVPTSVLAAGNRLAVVGKNTAWVLFDSSGKRLGAGKVDSVGVRLDRATGAVVRDETRAEDTPDGAKVAAHAGLVVLVDHGGIHVGERPIEGSFEALEVAIDDLGTACVLLKQKGEIVLWTIPIQASSGFGRYRIPGPSRVFAPPVLGKSLRIVSGDTGLVALALDGKKVWERRGIPSGGTSITADDVALVADGSRLFAIDPRGGTSELWNAKDVVFLTPPILNAAGMLFVASTEALHAFSVD